jgi:hypothetical protein
MAMARPGPRVRLRLVLRRDTARAFKNVLAAAQRHPKLVQMFRLDEAGVPVWAALLALLGDFVTTWDIDMAGRRPSAQRSYSRDGWRHTIFDRL